MKNIKRLFLALFSSFTLAVGGLSVLEDTKPAKADGEEPVYVDFGCSGGYFRDTGEEHRFIPLEFGQTVAEADPNIDAPAHSDPTYVFQGWRERDTEYIYPGINAYFIPITRVMMFEAIWKIPGPELLQITCDPADAGYIQNDEGYSVEENDVICFAGTTIEIHHGSDLHFMNIVANEGYEFDYLEDEYGDIYEDYRYITVTNYVKLTCHFKHRHGDWDYSVNGETLTATCGYDSCEDPAYSISLSLEGPGHEVPYTGEPYEAVYNAEQKSAWSSMFGWLPLVEVVPEAGSELTEGKAVEPGVYTFRFKPSAIEEYASYQIKIVASHTHGVNPTKVDGKDPTVGESGYKECYKCECGEYFEDIECTISIGSETDLAAWRAESGSGYLAPLSPSSGLSGGAIAGIVIGSIFGLLLIIFIVGYILWKKKNFRIPLLEKILTPAYRGINKLFFKTKYNDVELEEQKQQEAEEIKAE